MNDQPLIFLADESCDFAFVRALRQVGYDVTAIVEFMSGASDLKVLELAFKAQTLPASGINPGRPINPDNEFNPARMLDPQNPHIRNYIKNGNI